MTVPHPRTWKKCRLGDLFRIKHGYAFKGEFFSNEGDLLVLTPGNFRSEGGLKIEGEQKYYTGEFPREFLLKRGDLLLVMTDLTQNAPILGSPAFMPADGKYLHNQRLGKIVELREDEISVRFLFYLLNTRGVRGQIKASASGATVRHTSPDRIYAVKVVLPPKPEQEKIAAILSAYDDLIENNRRRIKILEEMARAMYREWFVEFRAPGVRLLKATSAQKKATGKDEFPEGWGIGILSELVENIRDTTKAGPHLEARPYVPIDILPRKSLALREWRPGREAQSSLCLFSKGDVLFGAMRAYFHKVALAPFDGVTRSTCLVLRPLGPEGYAYSAMTLFEERTVGYAAGHSRGTTIPYAVWRGGLESMPVVKPPTPVLARFEEVAKPILSRIALSGVLETNLRKTRDLLLPRLMSGDVCVEDLLIAGANGEVGSSRGE